MANKSEKNELFRELKNDPSERKKSFENWLVEKEVTQDIFTARMLEEERLKQLEKEKLEEERRLRYTIPFSVGDDVMLVIYYSDIFVTNVIK